MVRRPRLDADTAARSALALVGAGVLVVPIFTGHHR